SERSVSSRKQILRACGAQDDSLPRFAEGGKERKQEGLAPALRRTKLRAVTLQRKLLLGFALMVLPTLFVGVQAIRTNALERGTLETLGQRLARSRTYADVEDAMFNQTQVIWRYLGGDLTAKQEFPLSVQGAVAQMRSIVEAKRRVLWATGFVALVAGLLASWLISRDLARPLTELRHAMAVVGAGDLDHAIVPRSSDEVGELARAFARMTEQLRQSRAQLVQSEKLASIGQMAAAVAHGLRNPLASLRAAAQLARHRVDAPAAREQLDAIVEQVDRLDLRIAHLLQFSRPARAVPWSRSRTQGPVSLPRFSPTWASRSSRRGPRERVSGSPLPSATWRRRAADSTSRARSAGARRCGSGFPAPAARSRPSRYGVSRERLDRADRGRRAVAGAIRQGVPRRPRL